MLKQVVHIVTTRF